MHCRTMRLVEGAVLVQHWAHIPLNESFIIITFMAEPCFYEQLHFRRQDAYLFKR